jgi:erythromycin esterase-like protein
MHHDPYETPRERAEREESIRIVAELRERQMAEDLRWLVEHPQGRRIVWALLDETRVLQSPFHTSGSVMAFKAGEQNVGLRLFARLMEHAPDAYVLMLKEAAERAAKDQKGAEREPG